MSSRTLWTLLAVSLACIALPARASAQILNIQKPPTHHIIERIAEGKVVDKAGTAVGGAIVYLKNSHTNAVRTYIADDGGNFRFGELAQDTDYELWAESNGIRSHSREISSFDNETKFYFIFKIIGAKPVSLDSPTTPQP